MFIQWSPAFDTDVPRVDRQHRRLAEFVDELHSCRRRGPAASTLRALMQYGEQHCHAEELLMAEVHYPALSRHRREHERLTLEIAFLEEQLEAGDVELDDETLAFLKRWLLDHILEFDRKLGEYVQRCGIPQHWQADEL